MTSLLKATRDPPTGDGADPTGKEQTTLEKRKSTNRKEKLSRCYTAVLQREVTEAVKDSAQSWAKGITGNKNSNPRLREGKSVYLEHPRSSSHKDPS